MFSEYYYVLICIINKHKEHAITTHHYYPDHIFLFLYPLTIILYINIIFLILF